MENNDNIGRQLRRLALSADNRRFLRGLSVFQIETKQPSKFDDLLGRLDLAEARSTRR